MHYSILLILAVILIFYLKRSFTQAPPEQRTQWLKKWGLIGAGALLLVLVVTGRASWIVAAFAGAIAIGARIAQLVGLIPLFQSLMGKVRGKETHNSSPTASPRDLSPEQAAELLGVPVSASADEIRDAHKRLMQKIHPDRGGSEVLAKQINKAKKVLLDYHGFS